MSHLSSLGTAVVCVFCCLGVLVGHSAGLAQSDNATPANSVFSAGQDSWYTDYALAMEAADRQRKMLLLFFVDPAGSEACRKFESTVLSEPAVQARLQSAVCARLPVNLQVRMQGQPVVLLEQPAYAALGRRPGVAIVDLMHREPRLYGRVVSCFPLEDGRRYSVQDLATLLDPSPAVQSANPANPANPSQPALLPERLQAAAAPLGAGVEDLWFADYASAMEAAITQQKMMFVYFCPNVDDPRCTQFECQTLADPQILERLRRVVKVKMPFSAKIRLQGQEVELLKQPAFAEMQGTAGLAVLDFAHKDAPYYGHVVSTFPFLHGCPYTSQEMAVILDLPPGTLTQRTLIYALRTHPERPDSTEGVMHATLVQEAESHADYQARIGLQGHHQWEYRFHRINALLPGGLLASEVCAESWPGQGLLESAIECVRCWRLSSGHWGAVSQRHPVFGYDMKRGANGIWYATGIFGRQ